VVFVEPELRTIVTHANTVEELQFFGQQDRRHPFDSQAGVAQHRRRAIPGFVDATAHNQAEQWEQLEVPSALGQRRMAHEHSFGVRDGVKHSPTYEVGRFYLNSTGYSADANTNDAAGLHRRQKFLLKEVA